MTTEDLLKLRDSYLATAKEELAEFDKNFFLVSAGLFAFTVTFIQEIVALEKAQWVPLLLASWGFLAVSLGFILYAFFSASFLSLQQAENLDGLLKQYRALPPNIEIGYDPHQLARKLSTEAVQKYGFRLYAIIAFLLGLALLSIFLIRNFYLKSEPQLSTVKPNAAEATVSQSHLHDSISTETEITKNTNTSANSFKTLTKESTTIKSFDTTRASSILTIKPDTLYIKTLGGNCPPVAACSCPPSSHVCTLKCKMPRKKAAH